MIPTIIVHFCMHLTTYVIHVWTLTWLTMYNQVKVHTWRRMSPNQIETKIRGHFYIAIGGQLDDFHLHWDILVWFSNIRRYIRHGLTWLKLCMYGYEMMCISMHEYLLDPARSEQFPSPYLSRLKSYWAEIQNLSYLLLRIL